MPPPEKPLPLPKPKPPKPKPKPKTGPELKPRAARPQPQPEPEWDVTAAGVPTLPDAFSCAENCSESCAHYHFCPLAPPPPSPAATLHLRSSRLPTPLIALSASLLAISAVLLLALLVHRLVRRRRRRRRAQNAPPLAQHDEERGAVLAAVAEGAGEEEEDEDVDGGVHHVWYIRTKGLDERAIAAIAAVVYDAKKRGAPGGGGDGSCAVCLAEFRDGETLRLLPRCGHAFHRGCIDTWLRAHVNCPLCRAPVQVAAAAKANAAASGEDAAILGAAGGAQTQDAERGGLPESAVRRAASMVALPRRAWPDVSLRAPASNSAREEEMTGLGKIRRLLKFSEALEMAGVGVGRSISFGGAGSCQRLPARTGPSAAAGVSGDEMETSQ